MAYNKKQLDQIYHSTSGYCHLCHAKLARTNYGRRGERGAWEVEHSVPRSKGGTDHANNLRPACIGCNQHKSNTTTRTARGWNGKTRAPLSREKRRKAKTGTAVAGAVTLGTLGLAVAGPLGAAIGALAGGHLGSRINPDK